MIVIPTGTDAPIYHWPYATVGLIVLNVVLLFLVPATSPTPEIDDEGNVVTQQRDETSFERYALRLGDGRLHPIQWVTHNFLHFNLLHLAGNMLFLWSFGIVIEGKLGAVKYLLAYLSIGTLHGAMMQLALLRSGMDIPAAGTSAVIYGLLAACMIWRPQRVELHRDFLHRASHPGIPVGSLLHNRRLALCGRAVARTHFLGIDRRKIMVTELGHLSGAFWGCVVAIVLLKTGLVDCEGWDVFSLWAKNRKLASDWKKRGELLDRSNRPERPRGKSRSSKSAVEGSRADGALTEGDDRRAVAVRKIRRLIDTGDTDAAASAYSQAAKTLFGWPPPQPELYELIKSFQARDADVASIPLMRDHCQHYPRDSAKVGLKLAQVLLRNCQAPCRQRGRSFRASLPARFPQTSRRSVRSSRARRSS